MGKIEKIENVDVGLLVPYAKNAKIHGKKQLEKLKDSIQEFGFLTPCLIDKDFNVIAGHGRIMAAKELKRRCFMMEYDPHYADVIISRWEELTGKKAKLINQIV